MHNIGDKLIITVGDTHGRFKRFSQLISSVNLSDCVIIQVGDFGLGFQPLKKDLLEMEELNSFLTTLNIFLYVIRGNHDDPKFYTGDKYFFSNIILLKDYSTITYGTEGKKILAVGGAVSVDRQANPYERNALGEPWVGRFEGIDYWKDEVFALDEEKLKTFKDIDIVITHSAPDFCFPYGVGVSNWIKSDQTLYKDLIKERSDLTKMYNILSENNNIRQWCYGHFHNQKIEEHGVNNTRFKLLDIEEFYEIR
jgi:hypothetical protein